MHSFSDETAEGRVLYRDPCVGSRVEHRVMEVSFSPFVNKSRVLAKVIRLHLEVLAYIPNSVPSLNARTPFGDRSY